MSIPKNTIVLVTCPLGKENPVSGTMPFVGLGDWMMSFVASTIRVMAPMAATSKIADLRWCLM